nr:quinone oxidoreductase [Aeromicrobium sp.]
RLTAGETLVVLGAGGGVGLAAVELGVAMGAKVVAVASTPDKRAACLEHGAHEVVDPTDGDLRSSLERLLGPRGVDVVIDPVGGAHTEPLVRSLAIDGRYLVVGFASGSIPSIALNLPLLKLTSIIGVHWGPWLDARPAASAVEMAELLALLEAGSLRPHVSATYPFDRAAEALAFVVSRASVGKVVLVPGAVD